MEKIEIYSSKKKSSLLLVGSIIFVILCLFVLTADVNLYKKVAGAVGLVFFGFGIYTSIRQLIKKKLMLVIDEQGINVNPEKSDEKILWQYIESFPIFYISGTKIILICVNNPQYWIDKETNTIRKKLMDFNYNNYGTPFSLSANSMQIKHTELVDLLNNCLEKYKVKNSN